MTRIYVEFEANRTPFEAFTLTDNGFIIDTHPVKLSIWLGNEVYDYEKLEEGKRLTIISKVSGSKITARPLIKSIKILEA